MHVLRDKAIIDWVMVGQANATKRPLSRSDLVSLALVAHGHILAVSSRGEAENLLPSTSSIKLETP